jgi:hypothetical protein
MSKTFYGVSKMSSQHFYCEAVWHDDARPRGPIRSGGGRAQVSVDATGWPKTDRRMMRVTGGGGNILVRFRDGKIHALPGRVCMACLEVLKEELRPTQAEGQQSLL